MAVLSMIRSYVPTVGGNAELPEGERIVAKLRSVDVLTRQTQIRKFINTKPEDFVKMLMEDKASAEIKSLLLKCVVGFENLTVQDEQGGVRSATLEDVWTMGEMNLCLELFTNILNNSQLSKEQEKNSESQSGSTPE